MKIILVGPLAAEAAKAVSLGALQRQKDADEHDKYIISLLSCLGRELMLTPNVHLVPT
jgi:hypothetical protein